MSTANYRFNYKEMEISDKEIGISIKVSCSPILLPENASDGMELGDGFSVAQTFSRNDKEQVLSSYVCKNNRSCGEFREYYEEGSVKNVRYYHFDENETPFSVLHGPCIYYSLDKKMLSSSWYCYGKLQGKVEDFFLSGKKYSLRRYSNGVMEGKQEYFYENGNLKTEQFYSLGLLDGYCSLFFDNGQFFRKVPYYKGEKHGLEEEWNAKGVKISEKFFKNNTLKKEIFWNHRKVLLQEKEFLGPSEKLNFKKWSKVGNLLEEGKYTDERYRYREWDIKQKLLKEYSGFWDGEKLTIDKFSKGFLTPGDVAIMTKSAVNDLADRQEKYRKKETTQKKLDGLQKEKDRNQ
jgi:antitoxin component YwqK of YwqJK toxin-antitoxin module